MKINTLSRSGFLAYQGPIVDESYEHVIQPVSSINQLTGIKLSPILTNDGKISAFVLSNKVVVFDTTVEQSLFTIECLELQFVEFSSIGNYLITWSRSIKSTKENPEPNHHIWNMKDGSLTMSFFQKTHKKDVIQWSTDDKYMFHQVTNEIRIYNGDDLTLGIISKVQHSGFILYKVSAVLNNSGRFNCNKNIIFMVFLKCKLCNQ